MTVSGGSKAFHRIVGLKRGELPKVTRGVATEQQADGIIVVDCSNLMFGVGSKVKATAEYLFEFAKSGLTMLPVCDNDVRPSVKQETIKRRAKREKARTEEYLLRKEIRALKKRLNEEALTQQQRSELLVVIKGKETQRKRKETASYRPAIADFAVELENELDLLSAHIINEAGGSVLKVVTAQCQADAYMAGQIRNKLAVMVLSTDTDIPLFTGDWCISIKGFSKKNFELVSTSKATLESAMKYVGADSKAELIAAVHPIFEGVNDDRLRSLMMIIAGCDVYPSGLKNVGIPTLSKTIDTFKKTAVDPQDETALFEHLVGVMKKEFKPRLIEEVKEVDGEDSEAFADSEAEKIVLTLVDALVYEPTNKAGEEIKSYLGGDAPKELSRYCEEFAASTTQINRGPTILKCKGVGGKAHNFLAACGHGKCAKCKHDLCTYCETTIGMDTNTYCLLCGATESLVPEIATEAAKSVDDRRNRLIDVHQFSGANDLDSDEVEDVLEMMDFLRDYRERGDTVPFPLYKTEEMEAPTTAKWEEIAEIDFSNGGAFIADGSIDQKHIPGILKFFAAVVTFASPDEKHTEWKKDSAIYDALPKLLIDFAAKSRVDSGHRLLSRCLRHALDSKCPSLENKVATLILHKGDVGIRIHSAVPASMRKKVVYKPGMVFTANDVLCCECNCQCGSEKDERIVCIHNFPLLFLLLLLLMDALAESMLMEFAACTRSDIWDETLWSGEEAKSMKQSVVTLAEAAGEDMGEIDLYKISIDDLMNKFETGTEGRKKWKQRLKSKPKPGDHCCVADIGIFESTATEAKKLTSRRPMHVGMQESDAQEENGVAFYGQEGDAKTPNYVDMDLLINAAGCEEVLDSGPIAWELLKMRAMKQRDESTLDTRTLLSKSKESKKRWCELIRLGSKRIHRSNKDTLEHHVKKKSRVDATSLPPVSTAINCSSPNRVVTPTELFPTEQSPPIINSTLQASSVKNPSRVTPTPKKRKQLRRPGHDLPSRPTATPSAQQEDEKKKVKRISHRCCKKGCSHNNRDSPDTRFFCVPMPRAPLKSNTPKKEALINHAGAVLLRQEILDRTISQRFNKKKKRYYVCEHHDFEEVRKSTAVTLNNGEKFYVTYKLVVPSGAGPSTESKTMSRGTGRDRGVVKTLEKAFGEDKESGKDEGWAMCAQKMAEESCPDQHRMQLNPTVAVAANIPLQKGNADDFLLNDKLFRVSPVTKTKTRRRKVDGSPVVKPGMSDSEVKRRTGFPNEKTMLSYIIVVCDGDVDKIKERQTSLTWYEEWFMTFEYVWNRSLTRVEDVEKTFSDLRREDILKVIDAKQYICRSSRESWPMFASFEEDKKLQKDKWTSRYHGMRPVMWDMTGISAYAFSNADWQRLTFSSYYSENCFKAGIFCQPCGWMGTINAWTGGVSDSDYNRRAGYLKKQQEFQEKDLVEIDGERRVIRFLNIYDKGYRAKMAAWENGRQLVLQPDFKESDKRFNRDQTISSASVASDRGGNERVVNVSKRAGLISKGFQPNADPIRFNNVWLTWSFQANFMFDRVL